MTVVTTRTIPNEVAKHKINANEAAKRTMVNEVAKHKNNANESANHKHNDRKR